MFFIILFSGKKTLDFLNQPQPICLSQSESSYVDPITIVVFTLLFSTLGVFSHLSSNEVHKISPKSVEDLAKKINKLNKKLIKYEKSDGDLIEIEKVLRKIFKITGHILTDSYDKKFGLPNDKMKVFLLDGAICQLKNQKCLEGIINKPEIHKEIDVIQQVSGNYFRFIPDELLDYLLHSIIKNNASEIGCK